MIQMHINLSFFVTNSMKSISIILVKIKTRNTLRIVKKQALILLKRVELRNMFGSGVKYGNCLCKTTTAKINDFSW